MGRQILDPKYVTEPNPKCKQACRSVESTPGDPGKLVTMDRVRSSRSTSGGVEVARRGVAGRLQPTLSEGPEALSGRVDSAGPRSVVRRGGAGNDSR